MKIEVTVTPRSFVESAADISVPLERIRGEGGGPPIEMCEHFDAFSDRLQSSDHWNAAREKKDSVDEVVLHLAVPSCL